MAESIRDVNIAEFQGAVIDRSHDHPVVVDFWAEWCGPCKVLGPTLERLASEGGGSWELAKVDVDVNQQLAMHYGVQGIPTVIAFRDGQAIDRFTGALPEAQVRAFIERIVPSELDMAAAAAEMALDRGDRAGAEAGFRAVLAQDAGHQIAGLGLAALLLEDGDAHSALEILGRLAPTEAVRQLQAAARLSGSGDLTALAAAAESGAGSAVLDYGRALAGAGRYEEAFDRLLDVVGRRQEDVSEEARLLMLDLFELLGPEHPLTAAYRRRLASALF